MKKDFNLHSGKRGAALAVQVFPRSQHNEITEISRDGAIKILLRSSGSDSEINRCLIDFLAGVLSVKRSQVQVVVGKRSRKKLISILDLSPTTAQERILNHLS